ncbi:MAG: fumarylacetoacetase [Phycisphaerae bacterium]
MTDTTDPRLRSWIEVSQQCDFPIQNLPYGVFQRPGSDPAVGVAIGDFVLDLAALHEAGLLAGTPVSGENVFARRHLNAFMERGRAAWTQVRTRISELLASDNATLRDNQTLRTRSLVPLAEVDLLLPVKIGDFTDFYSSREHATNVGTMFRGPDNALMPNWLHLPIGYHGRASTVFVSGVDVRRPMGQTKVDDADAPSFGPSRLLDFELEMGFFVGTANPDGRPIATANARDHIFGMVLLNDWSARDIQKWEYVPLGPFLGKSFATSISPWVVTLDALEPFRTAGPKQDPPVLGYLQCGEAGAYDVHLEACLKSEAMAEPMCITRTNFKYMYWNAAQQLAHHTINGTRMSVGDLCGSGTISGPTEDSRGSMLEICWKGTKPIKLPDGSERKFFADGDTVAIRGWCQGDGYRVGFGKVQAKVLPALS